MASLAGPNATAVYLVSSVAVSPTPTRLESWRDGSYRPPGPCGIYTGFASGFRWTLCQRAAFWWCRTGILVGPS